MNADNRGLRIRCGLFGIAAVLCYFIGALVELPVPPGIMLLVLFGFAAFGITHWYLLRSIASEVGRNTYADLALIFTSAAFTLLIAMVMVQMAVRIGIGDMQAQAGDGMEEDRLKMILTGLRYVDLGLDVAWDYFIGTAFVLTGVAVRRVSGLGFVWGVPMAVVGAAIVLLNAWTFPWPPNTRDLFDVGPFAGLYMLIFSIRILVLGLGKKVPGME